MAEVSRVITHILHHVDAEAATSDPSQVAGVAKRAQMVRDAVESLKTDSRDLTLADLLIAIGDLVPGGSDKASLRRTLDNIEQRPQLAIQAWVGKNVETR